MTLRLSLRWTLRLWSMRSRLKLFETGRCHMAVLVQPPPHAPSADSEVQADQLAEVIQVLRFRVLPG